MENRKQIFCHHTIRGFRRFRFVEWLIIIVDYKNELRKIAGLLQAYSIPCEGKPDSLYCMYTPWSIVANIANTKTYKSWTYVFPIPTHSSRIYQVVYCRGFTNRKKFFENFFETVGEDFLLLFTIIYDNKRYTLKPFRKNVVNIYYCSFSLHICVQ